MFTRNIVTRTVGLAAAGFIATVGMASTAQAEADTPPNAHFSVSVADDGSGLTDVQGWAYDVDDLDAKLAVTFSLDGDWLNVTTADKFSPELAPWGLFYSGFGWSGATLSGGEHTLCMFVENVGPTPDQGVLTQCETFDVQSDSPYGFLDSSFDHDGDGGFYGWAMDDSDPTESIDVILTRDGEIVAYQHASRPSPELGTPGNHGFYFEMNQPGRHEFCAFAVNIGAGQSTMIGCVDFR